MQKIRAEIHLRNIKHNAEAFKTLTGKKLCAVVKADAYGHGAEEVALALEGVADCFAVSLLEEAVAIRSAVCGKDILILTPPLDVWEAVAAAKNGFIVSVGDLYSAKLVAAAGEKCKIPVRVHIQINTGMNRYGTYGSWLGRVCAFLHNRSFVKVEGIYSHLHDYTRANALLQRERFLAAERVCRKYFPKCIRHLSATYGALLGREFTFDMVRVGIGLYGYLPDGAEDIDEALVQELDLKKGMTVYAPVVTTRKYSFGGAGYGKPLDEKQAQKIKDLHIYRYGYADGFLRNKENGVCGFEDHANNLCMDACVRVGKAKRGAEIALLIDAAETGKRVGTISYEVLCAATRRAERVYDYD
ncbi:MAG: alanine racemase [Clostridia bacterium]|nr:alanine racemase [Clostridia bacterium]